MMNIENRVVSYLAGVFVAAGAMPFVFGQAGASSPSPTNPPASASSAGSGASATPGVAGLGGAPSGQGSASAAGGLTTATFTVFVPVDCTPGTQQTCPPGSTGSTLTPPASSFPTAPAPADAVANWNTTTNPSIPLLQIPKYVPTPGFCERVIQVDINARMTARGSLAVENRDPLNGCVADIDLDINTQIVPLGVPGLAPLVITQNFGQQATLAPFDGTVDFTGPSGTALTFPPVTATICKRFILPNEIATFVDTTPGDPTDNVIFADHSANSSSSFAPCAPITFLSDPFARVEIDVTYTICRFTPPVLNNDTGSACVGSPIDICVFANDTSDGPLTCPAPGTNTGITVPVGWTGVWAAGTCTGGANTCNGIVLRLTPPVGFTGTQSTGISYTLGDVDGCSDSASVTAIVNTPPNAVNDLATTCLGVPININALANDTSDTPINCAGIVIGRVVPQGAGTVTVTSDPACVNSLCNLTCLRFAPAPGFVGSATFAYTLVDADGCTDQATVSVNVLTPPTLNDDAAATCPGTPVDVCVFANDTSDTPLICPAPGSSTGISNVPAGWTAVWAAGTCTGGANTCNGTVLRITPPAGAAPGSTIAARYTLADTDVCRDFADVTVTIRTPPVLANDSAASCAGTPVDVCVFANDSSDTPLVCPAPGGSTGITNVPAGWSAVWAAGTCTGGANTCNGVVLRITPPAGATPGAVVAARYTLSDTDTCSDFADVTVNILTPPNLVNDSASTCPGAPVDVCVFANDTSDTPLVCPTAGSTTGITNVPAGWTAVWAAGACTGGANTCNGIVLRLTPPAGGAPGTTVAARYTLSDADGCPDFADVSVTVRTPPNLVNDAASTCPDAAVDVCVFANDSTDTPLVCPTPGSSTGITNVPAGWTAVWAAGTCTGAANTCNGIVLRITPPAGTPPGTTVAARYTLADTDTCTDFADVSVTIRTPPNVVNDSIATCPGVPVDVCVFANDSTDTPLVCPTPGTTTGITNVPAGWTAVWAAGTCTGGANTCNGVVLRLTPPVGGAPGTTIGARYQICDADGCCDFGDVSVTVRTPPVLVNDAASTCPGTPIDVCVFANDSSDTPLVCPAPGTTTGITNVPAGWTAVWAAGSCTGGANTCNGIVLRLTPPVGGAPGTTVAARYTLADTDTCTDFADVSITVRTPPVLVNDAGSTCVGAPIDLCVFSNDTSDTPLVCPTPGTTTGITNVPAGWTAVWAAGTCTGGANTCNGVVLRITPPAGGAPGTTVAARYTLADTDTCTDFADVSVTVLTPPNLVNDSASTCPGTAVDVCVFSNDTSDTPLVCPTPGSTTGITNVPAGWTAVWAAGTCTGGPNTCNGVVLRITPPAGGAPGTTVVARYTLADTDTCTDFADVSVTVRTPPVLANDTGTGCQGSPINVCVFANDTSDTPLACPAPGSSTGISNVPAGWTAVWAVGSCTGGTNTCSGIVMRITPPAAFTGTLAPGIRYTLADTDTCVDFADVTVVVNTPPVLADDAALTCPGAPVDVCVFANDTSDTPLVCPAPGTTTGITNVPAGWTAVWAAGSCTGGANTCSGIVMRITPPASASGAILAARYCLADTDGCTDCGDVTVTVRTPPIAINDSASTCNGQPVLINILANDSSDTRLQCGNITVSDPPHGTAVVVDDPACVNSLCPGKCVLYTPDAGHSGSDSFTYTIRDTDGCTATATVTLNNCRTDAVDDAVALCLDESIVVDVLANDLTTCGTLRCPPVIGPLPPQITVEQVNCGGRNCGTCRLRITAIDLPAGPPFVVSFSYTIVNSETPPCGDTATVTVTIFPKPTLTVLPPITRPNGSDDPITIDILTGGDPGPGCEWDLSSIQITQQPLQGTVTIDATGQLIYDPFPTFVGTDRICYRVFNTCGCPAEGCVEIRDEQPCPTAHRQECGSLLLFPEFDNTGSNRTLVTITDGCCDGSAGNVRIEIIFINSTNCLETNRTYTLTPCDTLSFVTSFVGPPNARGYLYAFAKSQTVTPNNPNGTPIVYNHLIGQEVVIDGITNFDYAINAVSFKAFGNEGDFNDDDGDGIRDLNGLPDLAGSEYEQAPDQILIPRFLGQDPPGSGPSAYVSDIVLINLTGGSRFTTVVDITVFNDNEEPFSDQHQFTCWEKLPLATFSPWTLQSSLLGTNHAPNEINGLDRESGWMILDGATATSTSEAILDPAIYAVLIERSGGYHAADLPFELCLQDNGDLLPRSLFGDGPNPQAGDNQ